MERPRCALGPQILMLFGRGFSVWLLLLLSSLSAQAKNKVFAKDACLSTHPLEFYQDLYRIDVVVTGEDKKPHTFKFLFDTGYSNSSLSPQACKVIGCKIVGRHQMNPQDDFVVEKTSRATIKIGTQEFNMESLEIDDAETLSLVHVDGVIGGDIIFKSEIIVNLKDRYVCFPKSPVYKMTDVFRRFDAVYDAGRVWVSFLANGKKIDDYFLDSGSDVTSLLPKHIEQLKLKVRGKEERNSSMAGYHVVRNYGPVTVEFAGAEKTLKVIAETKDPQMRKLGTDILAPLILGFDPEAKFIFVGR